MRKVLQFGLPLGLLITLGAGAASAATVSAQPADAGASAPDATAAAQNDEDANKRKLCRSRRYTDVNDPEERKRRRAECAAFALNNPGGPKPVGGHGFVAPLGALAAAAAGTGVAVAADDNSPGSP